MEWNPLSELRARFIIVIDKVTTAQNSFGCQASGVSFLPFTALGRFVHIERARAAKARKKVAWNAFWRLVVQRPRLEVLISSWRIPIVFVLFQ